MSDHPSRFHNQGPVSPGLDITPAQWGDYLDTQFGVLRQRRDELIESANQLIEGYPIASRRTPGKPPPGFENWNEEIAGLASDLLKLQLKPLAKAIDNLRIAEKAPVLEASRIIDTYGKRFTSTLDAAIFGITGLLTRYLDELTRQKREAFDAEARRKREEDYDHD